METMSGWQLVPILSTKTAQIQPLMKSLLYTQSHQYRMVLHVFDSYRLEIEILLNCWFGLKQL